MSKSFNIGKIALALTLAGAAVISASAPTFAQTKGDTGGPEITPCVTKAQVPQYFPRAERIAVRDLGQGMFLVNYVRHYGYEDYFNGCTKQVEKHTRL